MPLLIWGPIFEVGVQQIDTQHRKLFDLADAIRAGKGMLPLGTILNELTHILRPIFIRRAVDGSKWVSCNC
jgi:hemerythrin